jgi:hypothetical protein
VERTLDKKGIVSSRVVGKVGKGVDGEKFSDIVQLEISPSCGRSSSLKYC